jgi:hypothetical protein
VAVDDGIIIHQRVEMAVLVVVLEAVALRELELLDKVLMEALKILIVLAQVAVVLEV